MLMAIGANLSSICGAITVAIALYRRTLPDNSKRSHS